MPLNAFDRRGLEIVNFGADMYFRTDIAHIEREALQIFSGEEAVCLLQTVAENLMMGKFIGPLPCKLDN